MTDETLTPEQLASEGKTAYQQDNLEAAARAFQAAAEGYRLAGDALNTAEMSNNLSVVLLIGKDAQAALQAVEGTDAVFAAAGDKRRQAMALGNRAAALEKLNRLDEALSAYEQAADLFKEIGEHGLRAPVLKSISTIKLRTGKQLESVAAWQAGLNEEEQPNIAKRLLKKLIQIPNKLIFRS